MTEQELKKLGRADLLQLVLDQDKAMDQLRERIAAMERAQREKAFSLKKFGSIAESSLQLNGVFEAAQRAADSYLAEAKATRDAAARRREEAEALFHRTKERCEAMEADTRQKCEGLIAAAEEKAKEHWLELEKDVIQRLENYTPGWEHEDEELLHLLGLRTEEPLEDVPEEPMEKPVEEVRMPYMEDLDRKYGLDYEDDDEDEDEEDAFVYEYSDDYDEDEDDE